MRVIPTFGILAVRTVLGAILTSQDVAGWITGFAVSGVSVNSLRCSGRRVSSDGRGAPPS